MHRRYIAVLILLAVVCVVLPHSALTGQHESELILREQGKEVSAELERRYARGIVPGEIIVKRKSSATPMVTEGRVSPLGFDAAARLGLDAAARPISGGAIVYRL